MPPPFGSPTPPLHVVDPESSRYCIGSAEVYDVDKSLEQLDPSPVEETPPGVSKDGYFPPPQRTSTFGLVNHRTPYYLLRAQRYSSYAFSVFTAFHITNTSIIPLITRSIPASNSYLLLTRPYYQSIVAEPLLVTIPLAVHITSGVALRLYRRYILVTKAGAESQSDRKRVSWPKISGTSALGYAATWVVLGHAALTRVLPLWVEGGSSSIGLDFVGHSISRLPGAPVLGLLAFDALVAVSVFHMTWGWSKWLSLSPSQATASDNKTRALRSKRRWWVINGVSAAVAVLWAAGGVGFVGRNGLVPGWVGKTYDDILRHLPAMAHRI